MTMAAACPLIVRNASCKGSDFFIDILLVRFDFIAEMIQRTGLAPAANSAATFSRKTTRQSMQESMSLKHEPDFKGNTATPPSVGPRAPGGCSEAPPRSHHHLFFFFTTLRPRVE